MSEPVLIDGHVVGSGHPTFVVAELSGNHNGSLDRAIETVRAAVAAGADAIKLQTFTADTLTIDCDLPAFRVEGTGPWAGRTLYDLYREAHTPWEWHADLFQVARDSGITIFSTPFDAAAIDLLESLGAPAYKIASFELPYDGLLKRVAATGKPVILSTGVANLEEISHAVSVLRGSGCTELVLLLCTSSYPAPDESMSLGALGGLAKATGCQVGLSDHSMGTIAAVVAVAYGACMVEKHITLSRNDGGVDSHFSLEPDELAELVVAVRRARLMARGDLYDRDAGATESLVFRRSLYVTADMQCGDRFGSENLRAIRPGYGLHPQYEDVFTGKTVARDIKRGTPVDWSMLQGS